jgi:hypothetical protein
MNSQTTIPKIHKSTLQHKVRRLITESGFEDFYPGIYHRKLTRLKTMKKNR